MTKNPGYLSLIPLGGVGEIGKNMMLFEYKEDLVCVDAGVMFPEEEMLGIDLVIPDFSYLVENKRRLRGIILTHGHEDHIGAMPYVLRDVRAPVYGTPLTLGILKSKLKEHDLNGGLRLEQVSAGQRIRLGDLEVEFIHANHSIPDVVALAIHSPAGTVIYASDFKFDQTPIDGRVMDFHKLAELGERGVLALLSDSTNAERPGYTLSEKVVGETFVETFRRAPGRILVATFASNVHRIQQIVDAAARFDRLICVVGRSMENVVRIASELGYLSIPEGMMVDLDEADDYPRERLVFITTGSQGEPMSALARVAAADHKRLGIIPGDTVIISASPIPGNEKLVNRTINHLFRQGADVIYHAFSGVHVSGHASQEELKLMINLCRPKYFVPIHGEYRMLVRHAQLARQVGIPEDNIIIPELGDVIRMGPNAIEKGERVRAGQILVDGFGVGDVGTVVLRDRKQLAEDGIMIVVVGVSKQDGSILAGPDVVSRGFVYMKESESLIEETKELARRIAEDCVSREGPDWGIIKNGIREALGQMLYERTKRRPMILPVIMEV